MRKASVCRPISTAAVRSRTTAPARGIPAIAGFGAACRAANPAAEIAHMTKVRDYGREILQTVPGLVLTGAQTAPHIISLALPGLRSQGIINCLQDKEIYVSAGSACAKGHRSHVLEAMAARPVIDGSIRVSLSAETPSRHGLPPRRPPVRKRNAES